MQFLEMEPDALWDGRGPTWLWALGLYNFPHETVGEAKIKKESEENAPRFIPYPLTINRGLIESSPSTGFEPMTYET